MKKHASIVLLVLLTATLPVASQEIRIHSIGTLRLPDLNSGFTLDGDRMAASRAKLFNPVNFSDSGTYSKNVTLQSGYYSSGSLEAITLTNGIDLFFFGAFRKNAAALVPFTQDEIDSLYAWSLRGGKLIIAEQCQQYGDTLQNLGARWGYSLHWQNPSAVEPTEQAAGYPVFNGPFGKVGRANMGKTSSGYLGTGNRPVSVLGTNSNGNPTLLIDCITRDLVIADVNVFTDLGGLSIGDGILNSQDRFWANTIVFMDSIDREFISPEIHPSGDSLVSTDYPVHNWLLNFEPIEGSQSRGILPGTDGYYQVVVSDHAGCPDTSAVFTVGAPGAPVIKCPADILATLGPDDAGATPDLSRPLVFDSDGIASLSNDAPATFPFGSTAVTWTVTDSLGNTSGCVQQVTVLESSETPGNDRYLEIPNTITPNNDGINDLFFIAHLPEQTSLIIFDRAENIVFQTSNYLNNWNGLNADNTPVPDGTYWFVLQPPNGKRRTGFLLVKTR